MAEYLVRYAGKGNHSIPLHIGEYIMAAVKDSIKILENIALTDDVFSMWLDASTIAKKAIPGQFVNLFSKDHSMMLPRPISICEIDKLGGRIRLVFRVVGKGTKEFSLLKRGDSIEVMGPLGNGFSIEGKKALIIGGGIGIPPLLQLSKDFAGEKHIVLGYRDTTFMEEDFRAYGNVYISTEDGSRGVKGNVVNAIEENNLDADIIYACGPTPMLKGLQQYAKEHNIKAQLSLEERMACGVGACLGCVCKSRSVDDHSMVNNKRVCKEGPVFYGDEVEL